MDRGAGACAGVRTAAPCGDRFCVPDDAACAAILYVEAGASGGSGSEDDPFGDLPDAAAAASTGDCIAIAEGSYTGAELPGGLSVFGAGAALVSVEGGPVGGTLVVGAGEGARVRGLRVGGPGVGVRLQDATGASVEETLVEGATGAGVALVAASASLANVTVRATGGNGVEVGADGSLALRDSLVGQNDGAGVASFGGGVAVAGCVVRDNASYGVALQGGESSIATSLIEDNGGVGLLVSAASAAIDSVEVAATRQVESGLARLVEAQAGADVEVSGESWFRDSEGQGVLIDASRFAMFGGRSTGSERGFWVQRTNDAEGTDVTLDGVEVSGNRFVGVGGTEAVGLVIQNGIVAGTASWTVPHEIGTVTAGDGVQALAGSVVYVEGVSFSANERAAAVFDASTGGVTGGTVDDDGGEYGLVIQNGATSEGFDADVTELSGDDALGVAPEALGGALPPEE